METVYIPVIGAVLAFDEYSPDTGGSVPLAVFRKLDWPGGLLAPGRMRKFFRDEYTLTFAQTIARSTFEIEYTIPTGTFEDHSAFVRVYLQLLMIRAGCRLAAPCHATHSLARVDELGETDIEIKMFNAQDVHFRRSSDALITQEMVQWTSRNVVDYTRQTAADNRLSLAYHALDAERFAASPAMSLLTLWSGLEAFLSIEHEQTFRLSLMTAYYLESESRARKLLFDQMRAAYAVRSAVTHGRKHPKGLAMNVDWIAEILRRCIVRAVETKSLPTTESLFFS